MIRTANCVSLLDSIFTYKAQTLVGAPRNYSQFGVKLLIMESPGQDCRRVAPTPWTLHMNVHITSLNTSVGGLVQLSWVQIKNSLNPERAYFSSVMCYFLVVNAAAVLGRLLFNKAFSTCLKDRACFN